MTAKDLTLRFYRNWEQLYGSRLPIPFGRAGKFFKQAVESSSAEAVASHVDFFFSGFVDSYAQRTGHSFSSFVSCYPAVVAQYQKTKQVQSKGAEASQNHKRLEAARLASAQFADVANGRDDDF